MTPVLPLTVAERGRRAGRVAEAMAVCIRARSRGLGRCSADCLARDGFTAAEILEHRDEAVALAADDAAGRLAAHALYRAPAPTAVPL